MPDKSYFKFVVQNCCAGSQQGGRLAGTPYRERERIPAL